EMPGPAIWWGPKLAAAVDAGEVDRSVIERSRARLSLLARRTGAEGSPPAEEGAGGSLTAVSVAREAAAAAQVLLRNEPIDGAPVLPLAPAGLRIAVVGPNADREVIQGGGSARVTPTDVATIADGLRERYGADAVVVAPGPSASRGTPALQGADLRRADGTVGVDVEIIGADGAVRDRVRPRDFRIVFLDDSGGGGVVEAWSARASATFTARVSGTHRFKVRSNGDATLTVDGAEVGDAVDLVAGEPVALDLRVRTTAPRQRLGAELRCAPPEPADAFERAVAAATAADVAVVVVGLDGDWETEGRDRTSLELPGRQVDLIEAVAMAQPRTVVCVVAGSPVDLSWASEVPALLWCWLPGQEGGRAIADLLAGAVDPSGRLPCTFPARMEDTPALLDSPPDPGVIRYQEGVFCGHRWYDARGTDPAFPFGFGLSYTTFSLGLPALASPTVEPGEAIEVVVPVANTGDRPGTTVVQLYVGDPEASVRRPVRELRAFAKVEVEAGGSTEVGFRLTMRDLAFWDPGTDRWTAEAGEFRLWAGQSSRHLSEPTNVTLTGSWSAAAADPLPPRG
ncbi:MAG: glycoside hydrolase family 3 C-terminal domain-containing protein, partial [Acidimicrobiales bacterium]